MNSSSEASENKVELPVTTKKEIPPNLQKICLVCGDKALGYNFNAISCESCKAFFRRNALASKELKCPFINNCDITIVTRRFCQKCRLVKCLAVGMVKEFIMSEEDKAEKRKKIEENRAKKRNHSDVTQEPVTSSKNFKADDEKSPDYTPNSSDTGIIQYDTLNSTTCSPNSTMQSPLSNELDNSISSPPVYSQYEHSVESSYSTYHVYSDHNRYLEVNPIPEKTQYDSMDGYNINSIDSNIYEEKQNSIRSILTTENQIIYRDVKTHHVCEEYPSTSLRDIKPQHVCEEIPSTSSSNPDVNKAREILQDVERIEPNSIQSILCEAIRLEFEAYTSVNACNRSSRELNEVERAKLNELIVANKALHAPIDDDVTQLIGGHDAAGLHSGEAKHDPELIRIVNLTAVAIRRLIKMAKKINAFKNMCEEDQVALLKGGCTEMMVLRSTMTYDGQRNSWNIPSTCQGQFGNIKTDVLKLAKGNIYQDHESFISSFEQKWRLDEHIILILSAILLFTPDRQKVVHRDVIKLEQSSYYYLLRRYLESVYPGCEAKSTFLKLIQKVMELRKLAAEVTNVYLDVNPIEPLLMEIFDLKRHAV